MTRRLTLLFVLLLPLSAASEAHAFTIGSGISDGCHEKISAEAFRRFLAEMTPGNRRVRLGRRWHRLVRLIAEAAGTPEMTDTQAFVLASLIVGVRSPDTHGHSISELASLRRIHADPDPAGQYVHSLRAIADDYAEGDVAAVAGMRETLTSSVRAVVESLEAPAAEQLGTAEVYFDFYGVVEVPVYLPAYHFGRAAHTVQDSFAHALRDDATDLRQIVHVLNYVEAITNDFRERRDGVSHSDGMDSCTADQAPRVEAATQATLELLEAVVRYRDGDTTLLAGYLDRWFTLRPGCHTGNQFCDNQRWLDVARDGPTGPYLFGRRRDEDDLYDGRHHAR